MLSTYSILLLQGTLTTIAAWFLTALLSFSTGTLLALLSCRALGNGITIRVIDLYTFIAKGVPAYVQILIAYFVLPSLAGIDLSPFAAGITALTFCSSGFVTDIVRAGIDAIPKGQWQAAFVLNYNTKQTITRIIFPQAIRIMLPGLCGEFEQLLKSSSLLATIGIIEITRSGMNIISRELNPVPVYLTIAAIYLLLSTLLICIKKYIFSQGRPC